MGKDTFKTWKQTERKRNTRRRLFIMVVVGERKLKLEKHGGI